MLGIGWPELLLILVVAFIVIPPKDWPKVLRETGRAVGKIRSLTDAARREFETAMKIEK